MSCFFRTIVNTSTCTLRTTCLIKTTTISNNSSIIITSPGTRTFTCKTKINKLSSSSSSSGGSSTITTTNKIQTKKKQWWSLQSLASMTQNNEPLNETKKLQLQTTNNYNNNNQNKTSNQRYNADILLQDVNCRLAHQHDKCVQMLNQIIKNLDIIDATVLNNNNNNNNEKNENSDSCITYSSSSTTTIPATTAIVGEKKVIKAVNQVVTTNTTATTTTTTTTNIRNRKDDWKQLLVKSQDIINREKNKVIKILRNLEILHMDTFKLTQQLLENDKPTIQRFTKADQDLLTSTFEQIRSRHASTVENLADVMISIRHINKEQQKLLLLHNHNNKNNNDCDDDIDYNCNNENKSFSLIDTNLIVSFLHERLGIQLLCDHYVALSKQEKNRQNNRDRSSNDTSRVCGGVSVNCNFIDVLSDSILEAKMLCDANLGIAPEVYVVFDKCIEKIELRNGIIDDITIPITLIRPWIQHILVEVLKNAMSSNVEKFFLEEESSSNYNLPPNIYIRIYDSEEYLTCEVMDQGVGLDHDDHIEKAFEFAFSTSSQRWDRLDEQQSYAMVRSPLGSLGVGLTLSRMMIEMFGGKLSLSPRSAGISVGVDVSTNVSLKLDSGCTATVVLNRDSAYLELNRQRI